MATLATACVVRIIVLATRHQPTPVVTVFDKSTYTAYTDTRRLVLFLDAPDSIEAAGSRPRFREMAHSTDRSTGVRFVILDFTRELMSPFWHEMNEWFDVQSVQTLGYRGYGKTLWVLDGSVVHCEYKLYDKTVEHLNNLTSRYFLGGQNGHITK